MALKFRIISPVSYAGVIEVNKEKMVSQPEQALFGSRALARKPRTIFDRSGGIKSFDGILSPIERSNDRRKLLFKRMPLFSFSINCVKHKTSLLKVRVIVSLSSSSTKALITILSTYLNNISSK